MAFADPQSITITGIGASSLPRTGLGMDSGVFSKDDGNLRMSVQHIVGKRNRDSVKFTLTKIAADPLISAQSIIYTANFTVAVDKPKTGFTVTELTNMVVGCLANLSASSNANLIKLLGGES